MSSALARVAAFHARSLSFSSIGNRARIACVSGSMSAMVQKPAVAARPVEPNVPRRLLEWRDPDPAVFQRLGGQGGCAFDSDVSAGELGDRVISVTDENPLVELFGAPHGDHVVRLAGNRRQRLKAGVRLIDELVEQHPAKALLGARIPGEERPFHHLGQVAERENGAVEVGEISREDTRLRDVEFRRRFACH
jgi:hypothetical protein